MRSGAEEGSVEVLINDGTVSILAETTGPADQGTPNSGGWLPEMEMWQAPDGSASFDLVNSGNSVAYPEARETYQDGGLTYAEVSYFQDGVVVPGNDELGVDDFAPNGPPTFEAFAQTSTPRCSELSSPKCAFATLEPESDPDQVSNYGWEIGPQIASVTSGSDPGILGVDLTEPYGSGSFACKVSGSPASTDAYFYGSGLQSPTNNYNISPGEPDSAWKVAATRVPDDCPAGPAAVAGGPSGLGIFDSQYDTAVPVLRYRPFDQSMMAFDKPPVTVASDVSAATLGLSQDGSGDVYATGLLQDLAPVSPSAGASSGAPLALFYSSDGGRTWKGPGSLESTIQPGFSRSESAVGSDGTGWMVISAKGILYALQFSAADAGNSFAARFGVQSVANKTVVAQVSCYAIPCTISATLETGAATAAKAIVFGIASVKLKSHGLHRVKIRLTAAAVRDLKAHRGKVTVSLHEATKLGPYTAHRVLRVALREKLR